VSQPTSARIETGAEVPRLDPFDRLLAACGESIEALPASGTGVDRSGTLAILALLAALPNRKHH
jgi:hypothetical protein